MVSEKIKKKGMETLVDAFAGIAGAYPETRLLIVGSGPCGEPLERQAAALGVRDRCHFEPKTADVARWLQAIDIFVLPSLSEALSNSLMEAMASGCCVVASRTGGNPELTGEDERGILFEKGSASGLARVLIHLIADPGRRARLAAAGTAFIRAGFAMRKSIAGMQEIYESYLTR